MYITFKSLWFAIGFHFMYDFTISFINIESMQAGNISILQFKVPECIYIHGINIGCNLNIIFILIMLVLIGLVHITGRKIAFRDF